MLKNSEGAEKLEAKIIKSAHAALRRDGGQDDDWLDLKQIELAFLEELKRAQGNAETSLPFIRHQLSLSALVKDGEVFQVMVVGGSIFKLARVKKNGNGILVLDRHEEKLPIFNTEADFVNFIEKSVDAKARIAVINMAYPMTPVLENGVLDGILVSGSKEHEFAGMIGKRVGAVLTEYFLKKTGREIKFTVANDTVCLLLSGKNSADRWKNLACGVVGTGINFAFFNSADELINLESANFDKLPISPEARDIDKKSVKPGSGLFEKETAGGYLYKHFNMLVDAEKLDHRLLSSTLELKMLAIKNDSKAAYVARELIKKSAGLVACQIAGITEFRENDMIFIMEGSFFWENDIYKDFVEAYLRILAPEYKIEFVYIEDSPILGAARLLI